MPNQQPETETASGHLLAAALTLAEHGILVFPVKPRSKVPATVDGFKSATVNLDQVRAWWGRWPDANIGVPMGALSGFVVLDVDARHGGLASFEKLRDRHRLPKTAQVLTGSGGFHYWYRYTGELRNSAGLLGDGLDVRGDGGYVIAPPSVHESGNPYKWLHPLEDAIDWPQALAADAGKRRNGTAAKLDEVIPEGKRRAAMLTVAGKLKRSGLTGPEILPSLRELNKRCRPPLDQAELESVAYESSIEPDTETAIPTVPPYTGPPCALADVVAAFRKWLHLPDAGALYIALATVVANRLPGDPLWILFVAASSSGKTEILFSLGGLEEVTAAATMTEAALLSGTAKRDRAASATGGLLTRIGDYGILTLKDFGSVLSMHRDARAGLLAALREIYDGSWDRHVGVDGGKTLHWDGKLGLIAGVTTVVDRHHAVMDSLGSRFAFYRVDVDERDAQGMRALNHRAGVRDMRAELRDAVTGFFSGLDLPNGDSLSDADKTRLVTLADLVTMARSPVERDSYASREIEMVPDPEAPARFALMLAALLEGLQIIGLDAKHAWQLVNKTAFDSMPAHRRRILELLAQATATTKGAALALGLPTTTTRRTLEDLAAHHVIERESDGDGKADTWRLSAWTKARYDQ